MLCKPPKRPRELSREALVEIAAYAQRGLFWDIRGTKEFWNLDKDMSGSDFIEHMTGVLAKHDLMPEEQEDNA